MPMTTILKRAALALALVSGATSLSAETKQITGTAGYLERIALPPGAVLHVQLLDVSKQDVAATVLSAQRYAMAGVPHPFVLHYDSALIDERNAYTVAATIEVDGDTLYRTTSHTAVLTRDAGQTVDLVLRKASVENASAIRLQGQWEVFEVGGRMLVMDNPPIVDFTQPGSIGIKGACNSYIGEAEANGSNLTFSKSLAGTLKACPPEAEELDRALVDAIQNAARFERYDDVLVFVSENGLAQVRMRATAD